jgi:hypothetical protein
VCSGKGTEPIKPIVGDMLVSVQGDHAICAEIANSDFLQIGAAKIASISATPKPAPANASAQ